VHRQPARALSPDVCMHINQDVCIRSVPCNGRNCFENGQNMRSNGQNSNHCDTDMEPRTCMSDSDSEHNHCTANRNVNPEPRVPVEDCMDSDSEHSIPRENLQHVENCAKARVHSNNCNNVSYDIHININKVNFGTTSGAADSNNNTNNMIFGTASGAVNNNNTNDDNNNHHGHENNGCEHQNNGHYNGHHSPKDDYESVYHSHNQEYDSKYQGQNDQDDSRCVDCDQTSEGNSMHTYNDTVVQADFGKFHHKNNDQGDKRCGAHMDFAHFYPEKNDSSLIYMDVADQRPQNTSDTDRCLCMYTNIYMHICMCVYIQCVCICVCVCVCLCL
jgi:hypothetical protein